MTFKVREYKEIMEGTGHEDGFTDTKATLRGQHKAEVTAKLHQPRRHQVQFIDKAKELLDSSNKGALEKSQIITGLILLERAVIAGTYGETIFDATEKGEASKAYQGSTYFRCLGINIGLTLNKKVEENKLDYEDYRTLIYKTEGFIASHVYVEGVSAKGFKREHDFSGIEELNISMYLKMCASVAGSAKQKIVERNLAKQNKELRQEAEETLHKKTAETSSWFGGFASLWSSPIPKDKPKELENELNPVGSML